MQHKEQARTEGTSSLSSVVIITSNQQRHCFFVNRIAKELKVLGVVAEAKKPAPQGATAGDDEVIRRHFRERDEAESRYFVGNNSFNLPPERLLTIPHGESNSPRIFQWVSEWNPDYVLLYGSSIIHDPLLSRYEGRIINMHLGLSPYYRGSGTNFWPLVNREPECVGITVHLAVLKVDAGAILGQARPKAKVTDRCHDLGCKTIIEGVELMLRCLKAYRKGAIQPRPQSPGGRLYKARDFNAEAVRQMWRNFETGMIEEYLANPDRLKKFPIIER